MKDFVEEVRAASTGRIWFDRNAVALPATGGVPNAANINGPFKVSFVASDKSCGWYAETGKRILDLTIVLVTLPITLVLIALCAIALLREGGNVFYRQERLGRDGTRFSILKLRTMVPDADDRLQRLLASDPHLRTEWETTQKLKRDPRVTRLGAFLRRSSLDELPQIWNILRGDMSIVGPRPMLPEQLPLYDLPNTYFSLRPGLTGDWQVSSRNEDRFGLRAVMDANYAAKLGLWRDLTLIGRTFGVVLRRTGY